MQQRHLKLAQDSDNTPPTGRNNPQDPTGGSGGPGNKQGLPPARPRRQLLTWVVLFALVAVVWAIAFGGNGNQTGITWSAFKTLALNKPSKIELNSITIDDTRITATVPAGETGYDEKKPTEIYVTIWPPAPRSTSPRNSLTWV